MLLRKILFTFVLISISTLTFSQNYNDTIERTLIKPPTSNIGYIPPSWPPEPPYPWGTNWTTGYSGVLVFNQKPLCGEKFHENGNISSSCECNTDSIYHGKSVYWDERGFITNVYIYKKGRVFKEKHYSKGKIINIKNYAYGGDGSLFSHGKQTTIDNEFKTVETYRYGKIHGPTTKYENGIKFFEAIYSNEIMTSEKTWTLSGQLTLKKTHDLTTGIDSLTERNDTGILIKTEQTIVGSREGEWMIYDTKTDEKETTVYKRSKIQSTTTFRGNILHSRGFYNDGHPSNLVTYYLNGKKSSELIHLGLGKLEHISWSKGQNKTEHYTTQEDYLLSEGYYLMDDSTTAFFKAPNTIDPLEPVVRITISNGDTLQKDYLKNSVAYRNKILLSNSYSKSLREGLWKEYNNNYIDHVATYKSGILHGRAIYYNNNHNKPYPEFYGNHFDGLKNDNWTFISADLVKHISYKAGKKEGKLIKFCRKADTLVTMTETPYVNNIYGSKSTVRTTSINEQLDTMVVANYSNDVLDGEYYEFDSVGVVKIRGNYLNNKKHGLWYIYHSNGEIQKEGEFKNGLLNGKWYEWIPNKNGKLKRRKLES
ncbi:MAG: antitoxin component YwqK of YwqJK toxin-antitoxin module [Crocinitomicaceae bacterium]|jgi:antitoxin component YwqK of YwqJK toxin-antitoxin module